MCKFQTIQPPEIMEALDRAAGRSGSDDAGPHATPNEKAELQRLKSGGRFEELAWEWLNIQGQNFRHWEPAWLAEFDDVHRWRWGRRFLGWARGR
jgi:hypothetical protein